MPVRGRLLAWFLPVALLAGPLALAGCTEGDGRGASLPVLDFVPMSIETVPLEPFEARGILAVAWEEGRMAVSTEREGGMPAQAVRDGDLLYTTQAGMGWTRWGLDTYAAATGRGFRYAAWDAPALLAEAEVVSSSEGRFTAASSYAVGGTTTAVRIDVNHTGTAIVDLRIHTEQDPESPYTLRPLGHPLPFAPKVPAVWQPPEEVQRLDAQARVGHAKILGWVQQHRDQTGRLPQDVTAESLLVQRLGQAWPTNPYTSRPMVDAVASGDFDWSRCSDADGSFHGFGWDGAPLNQDFGVGCSR